MMTTATILTDIVVLPGAGECEPLRTCCLRFGAELTDPQEQDGDRVFWRFLFRLKFQSSHHEVYCTSNT
jgi:hypothetical protein